MRIDIYSDTVCPWCYLGKRRFDVAVAARPHFEPRVTWRPFELNPDLPADGVDRAAYLAARVGDAERVAAVHAELQRQGEASGIDFRFDLIRRMPNTRRSHLLIAHAARSGLQAAVKERIMRAYFEEGSDVGDTEELVRLAAEVGLSERAARSALVLRSGQDGVIAAERHAGVLGITGVPTFVFDGQYTVSGAQDVGTLARIFDQVADFAASRDIAS
ncbi:MAG TPA: DsbA family oxidoreductase [Steroidobacteraceae bacterium]|jgi:predicted DsbA family dithiol-disulfide isomerase|nr:DsbA family oxidoreductase [Steroidobacteraceae bacterium]